MNITIEDGYPIPNGRQSPDSRYGRFRTAIGTATTGQSFKIDKESDQNWCYRIAAELGVRIKTQKQADGGWRVWKL